MYKMFVILIMYSFQKKSSAVLIALFKHEWKSKTDLSDYIL